MKKLLLLLIVVLASVGVNAATFTWTSADEQYSVTASNVGDETQKLVVSGPGALAAFVEATKNNDDSHGGQMLGVGGAPYRPNLVIEGSMSASDFTAMNSTEVERWGNFKNIDLSSATISGIGDMGDMNLSGLEYLRLPNGVTDVTKMRSLTENGHNPNLKVAGAYEGSPTASGNPANKTEFAAYSFESGNMKEFCETLFHNPDGFGSEMTGNPHGNDLQKITFGGNIGVTDIAEGEGYGTPLFKSSNLNVFDLLESKFDDCDITITSSMGQGYINPIPTGTIHTNALHYLKNYKVTSCILPKYNDEIPPQTFANNTFNAQTVHIGDIVIPEGYKKIGFEAFYGHNLQTLDLPSTLEEVEAGAFRHNPGMSRLTDVTMQPLQGECSFGEAAFGENQMLKHVTLSEGVTNIADQMFNQCLLLESVRIPTTCKIIGRRAFYECYDLHVITIPEGVEEIYQEAFELTGLTDIYVMATSPATMPKIYAMGADGGSTNSTFTYQRTTGNNTVPAAHREDLGENTENGGWNADYDEVISWYQAEMSGAKGLGTGNALVALHYPDNMKGFYEGINVSEFFTEEELADVCGWSDSEFWVKLLNGPGVTQADINQKINGVDAQGNKFQYLPQAYSIDPHGDGSNPLMGPDKDGKYYPNQMDYVMRMAAGATPGNCMSAWGWRQFPLAAAIGDIGKIPFDKLYDDTWYTMCFPWHMTDNELFSAFNQNMEITEFVGVELVEQGDPEQNAANKDWSYEMVLHFDDVAVTTYRDLEDVEYERERIGHRVINGEDRSVYRYTSKTQVGGQTLVVEYPLAYTDTNGQAQNSSWQEPPGKNDNSAEAQAVREAYGKYLSIRNILSNAGHPYMIHPSIGAQPGNPATVYINAELKTGSPWTTNEQKVTKVATIDDQAKGDMNQGATEQPNKGGQTAFVNPVTNGGGSYTFIGNVGKESETDNVDADGNKVMPTPAYFLAVPQVGEVTETVDVYETQVQDVLDEHGNQLYNYVYCGTGGNVVRVYQDDHYEYVGAGNGNYTLTTPAHYEYAGNGQGNYIVTEWTHVDDNSGEYNGSVPVTYYTYNKGQGTYSVANSVETSNGAYNAVKAYIYVGTGGNYEPDPDKFVGPQYDGESYYKLENGQYVHTDNGYAGYKPTEYIQVAAGTGSIDYQILYYEYVGAPNGTHDVTFEWSGYSGYDYKQVPSNLTYQGASGYPYKASAWEQVQDNQGDWKYFEDTYNDVGAGEGDYVFLEAAITFQDVTDGSGNYNKVKRTKTVQVKVGTEEITRKIYSEYPKYYRKKQTSGNKWSKYSAIIQPDADAIANIEEFLDMAAAANGYNVALGEWEEVSTTAIEKIVEDAERNNEPVQKIHLNVVYNIKGQVVRNDGNASLEGLPKGLYIVNGKKYMVK